MREANITIIGAGFSGIAAAIYLKKSGINDFQILEKGSEVGGTWRDNVYPGVACDVPSVVYSFSFENKYDWSHDYSEGKEILGYLKACVKKYGINKHIVYKTSVDCAEFSESEKKWKLKVNASHEIHSRFLVLCTGGLSRPKLPNITGIENYKGKIIHSAMWDKDFDLKGKNVAVIGTGASAIQIIPSIVDKVASLSVFQRTPAWIMPKDQAEVGQLKKAILKYIPLTNKLRRLFYYLKFELRGLGLIYPKIFNKGGQKLALKFLARSISDEKIRQKLTPNYSIGCKRVLLSNDFYPAMNKKHVELICDGIESFSQDAIFTVDGKTRSFDAVICATGFKVAEEAPPFKILGRGSKDLDEHWNAGAHAYLGIATHHFPNLFFILGPNTGLGHNSIIYMIESQVKLLSRIFLHARKHSIDQIEISEMEENAYQEELGKQFQGSVWTDGSCKSWYLTKEGKNVSLWPNFSFSFRKRLSRANLSSFFTTS